MVKRKTVAVIGGGISGLAAAKAFAEKGHQVLGFERSHDLGGVWEPSRSYPGVQTQSPKELYCYTDHPMPQEYPEWPKGPQVHAYLHSYAHKHDLHRYFRLNAAVQEMDRRPDGRPGWRLVVETDGETRVQDVDFAVVCTGQFSEKNILSHPGQEDFKAQGGDVMHSSEYLDPGHARGKRVVVLGGSKSATDVAVNAVQNGARQVHLVYRQNVWRIPYFVGGINFKKLLYMRAQEAQFNGWGRSWLHKAIYSLAKPLIWVNFRGLETLLKLQLGLKKWDMVPDMPIEQDVSCSVPIVTPGLFEGFKSGSIIPRRTTISRYEGDEVVLENGDRIGADLVISAVGWKLGIPYLAQRHLDKLIEADGQYRTYRLSVNPDLPEMGFVGFNSSFCTILSAELVANWLVRFADGKLEKQPSRAEMEDNIQMMLDWRRKERPAAQIYGGLCSAPFHFKHFDELLMDMGAAQWKRSNPLVEQFAPPDASAYGRFLATAPQYTAA